MAKTEAIVRKGVTPKGQALWAKILTPDTKFNPDGVFEITLVMHEDDSECQNFMEKLDGWAQEAFDHETKSLKPGRKKQISVTPPYTMELDDETGDETGRVLFKFKTKAFFTTKTGRQISLAPGIFDAKGTKIKDPDFEVGNGSIVRVSFETRSYCMKDGAGISRKLKGVQVIDLVEYGGSSASSMGFTEEEGFVAPDKPQEVFDADDDGDNGDY